MVRKDLYITVPTFFKCPISLDVMKSPVSLSTGVTYDRASIQRWLDGGNNTCPATMQVLNTKELVPNRTLQRLIEIWSDSVLHRVESSPTTALTEEQVKQIIKEVEVKGDGNCFESLKKLVSFAKESDGNKEFLAKTDGFVLLLVNLLSSAESKTSFSLQLIEQVVKIVDMIKSGIEDKEHLSNLILKSNRDCLARMVLVFQRGNLDSKIESVRVLEYIAIDAESKLMIAEQDGVLTELLKSIGKEADPSLIEASLSCLISISTAKRAKQNLARIKTVTELKRLVTESSLTVSITEKALKLLEILSSCKEGRAEICGDDECVQGILQKLLKVSMAATEHAVTILWSVCYLLKDQNAQDMLRKSNAMTKILLIMQSNCSPSARHMAADLLKVFRVNSKSCLLIYDTKTTHIMPF